MNRKKIIIITSRFPFPLDKGDKLRIYYQIKYLSQHHNIYLISLNTENNINTYQIKELKKYCQEIFVIKISLINRIYNMLKSLMIQEPIQVGYFYSKKAHLKVNQIIKEINPDWCYAQLIRTAKYITKTDNNVIDYMDALSKGIERRIIDFPFFIQPIIRREYKITKEFECRIFNNFKQHTIITKNDRNYISHDKNEHINIIPNGVDTTYFYPNNEIKKEYDIVFVGNMSYPPNIKASIYLCEKIMPIIMQKYANCKVLIAGTNPHPKIQKLQSDNITISGWVEDIRTTYASGKVFVAPMYSGTGLQNKLLEAMAMGIPCITTELANKALLANKKQIKIAKTPQDFANNFMEIINNKTIANNLKKEGLKFIKEKYDWKKINNKLSKLFK